MELQFGAEPPCITETSTEQTLWATEHKSPSAVPLPWLLVIQEDGIYATTDTKLNRAWNFMLQNVEITSSVQ
jgi:hypothetical protein